MGRKDAGATQGAPVDVYRKQIGKHDYNKEKRKLKAEKKAAELRKTESPVKVMVLMVGSGLLLVTGLYMVLYWYLGNKQPAV